MAGEIDRTAVRTGGGAKTCYGCNAGVYIGAPILVSGERTELLACAGRYRNL